MKKLLFFEVMTLGMFLLASSGARADLRQEIVVKDHHALEVPGNRGSCLLSRKKKFVDDDLVYETPLTEDEERNYQMGIAVRRTRLTKPSV